MRKAVKRARTSWTGIVYIVLGILSAATVLWYRLDSLLPGVSKNELAQAASSASVEQLVKNPIGLPHKILQLILQHIQFSPLTIRSASVVIALILICSFYYVARSWYTNRIALLATLTFITAPWFLHVARIGTDISIYMLLFLTVACVTWLQKSQGSLLAVAASVLLIITLLYVPGMIWFVAPALLWQLNRIGSMLENQNAGLLTLLSLIVLVTLVPLGWAMFQDTHLIKVYMGLPETMPTLHQYLKNLAHIPYHLFWQGPNNPEVWLGDLPLLNWFSAVMTLVGMYALFRRRKLDRVIYIVAVGLIGSALVALGGSVDISILMPFVYLVSASGIALMLQQWFTVFPRNPFARTVGATVLSVVVLLAVFYNLNNYFVAWPNTPETKAIFNQHIQ